MYNFFKTMHEVADCNPKQYENIVELSKDIAISGGYKRVPFTYKNGNTVIRTTYNVPATWDDTLVAKWYCYYEKYFRKILATHPEMQEYQYFILQRTFTILFNSLQLDKLSTPQAFTALVRVALVNRIGEVLCILGSDARKAECNLITALKEQLRKGKITKEEYKAKVGNRTDGKLWKSEFQQKAFDNHIMSLEKVLNTTTATGDSNNDWKTPRIRDIETSDVIMDIKLRLKDNKFGTRLLDAMLYSDKKIKLNNIRSYIKLNQDELTDDSKIQIKAAYDIIKETLRDHVGTGYTDLPWDKDTEKKVSFNKDAAEDRMENYGVTCTL